MLTRTEKSTTMDKLLATAIVTAFLCVPSETVLSADEDSDSSEGEQERISESLVDPLNPFGDQQEGNSSNSQDTCQILIINPGVIRPNIESYILSSKELGGRVGSVNVTATNSSYQLSIDTPLGFTAMPAGGANDVTMDTSFSGTGATNFSER